MVTSQAFGIVNVAGRIAYSYSPVFCIVITLFVSLVLFVCVNGGQLFLGLAIVLS